MDDKSRYTITGFNLMRFKTVKVDLQCGESRYVFVTGKVLSPNGKPLPNSAVAIYRIDESSNQKKKIYAGVVFCDERGVYGISLPRSRKYSYIFKAYCEVQ